MGDKPFYATGDERSCRGIDCVGGMVTCSLHHTRRKAVYCRRVPVFNAAKEVVGYVYQCTKADECSSAARRGGGAGSGDGERAPHIFSSSTNLFSGVLDCSSSSVSKGTGTDRNSSTSHGSAFPQKKLPSQDDRKPLCKGEALTDAAGRVGPAESPLSKVTGDGVGGEGPEAGVPVNADEENNLGEEEIKGKKNHGQLGESGKVSSLVNTRKAESVNLISHGSTGKSFSPSIDAASDSTTVSTPRGGGNRYFELLERGPMRGTTSTSLHSELAGSGKVCWNCGLSGHEKTACTNTLCRSCHGMKLAESRDNSQSPARHRGSHTCLPVSISDFIVPITTLPADAALGMDQVQCVRCGELGHFDCGTLPSPYWPHSREMLSCCYCARAGHTAYDCSVRESERTDRWIQRMLREQSQAYHSSSGHSRNQNDYSAAPSFPMTSSNSYRDPRGWNENGGRGSSASYDSSSSRIVSPSPSYRSYSQNSPSDRHRYGPRGSYWGSYSSRGSESCASSSHHHHERNRKDDEYFHRSPSMDLRPFATPSSHAGTHEKKRRRADPDNVVYERRTQTNKCRREEGHRQHGNYVTASERRDTSHPYLGIASTSRHRRSSPKHRSNENSEYLPSSTPFQSSSPGGCTRDRDTPHRNDPYGTSFPHRRKT